MQSKNIFLSGSLDHAKIGDFGISKILHSKSKAFTVVGTPSYISPELCEGKPYNYKSDVWSLGCVLYEMCSLKRAFEVQNNHWGPGIRPIFGFYKGTGLFAVP